MASGINRLLNWIASWLGGSVAVDSVLGYIVASLVHIGLIINLIAVGALIFIWLERKISGRIQDRLGPTRVGGKFGWLQTLADGLKLITKEDLMPDGADGMLFRVAPYMSFGAAVTAYVAIPFAGGRYPWVAQHINTGVFFVIAVLGLEVFGVILAGYSSASKWSLFGAMREAAQVVSYEVPLGMCAVVPVMLAGSMDLVVIGDHQAGWFTNWYLLNDPATFIVFWVYVTCATASVNRAPFDLAEAESELVAGFHTEYSGLRWSFFFMAEYGSMLTVSLLAAILFLGGWHGPIPVTSLLGLQPTWLEGGWLSGAAGDGVAHFVCQLVGLTNVLAKGFIGVCVMMWIRWTLPRLRIDQVMVTCLKYCTPIAAVMFLGAALWQAWLPGRNFFGLMRAPAETYRLSEGWLAEADVAPATPADAAPADEGGADEASNETAQDSRRNDLEIAAGGNPSPTAPQQTTALRSVATGDRARLLPSLRGRGIREVGRADVSADFDVTNVQALARRAD